MKEIAIVQILTTPGCSGCAVVERMLDKMGIKYQLIDVTKNPEILEKYPIMAAPGIVIDGKLEFVGVPKEEKLLEKLKNQN
ncbi:MAG: glutaredoxin family protein [Nitrosopumilaceae archaeon]